MRDEIRIAIRRLAGSVASAALIVAVGPARAYGDDQALRAAPAGTYRVLSAAAGMGMGGFSRSLGSGTLTLDPAGKTFSLGTSGTAMQLTEVCRPKRSACGRAFFRSVGPSAVAASGTYELTGDGLILLTASAEGGPGETVQGFVNPAGSVVVIPLTRPDGFDLVVAMRPRAGVTAGVLEGTYDFVLRAAGFPKHEVTPRGSWSSYASIAGSGAVTVSGGAFVTQGSRTAMRAETTCTASGSGCGLSAVLTEAGSAEHGAGRVAVSASGEVTFTDQTRDVVLPGLVSDDGMLVVATEDGAERGYQALTVMARRGQGMSVADVDGVYNSLAIEDFFDSDGRIRTALVFGTLDYDGAGSWGFLGSDSGIRRVECQGGGACPSVSLASQTFHGATAGGTYTVGPDGAFDMTGLAADGTPRFFTGRVSSDGNVIVLGRVLDDDSASCRFDCAATQSVRSLIVGLRWN